jgi:peptidoglycan/xylan/chitin deacetylase (PgdA/CDA1 family)
VSAASCLIVMYHYVRDTQATPFPEIRALPPSMFERQLDWLQRVYTLVGLDALEAALDGARPLPPRAALLTFDDGFADHHEVVLPVLRRRGLTGVFFLAHDACAPSPRVLGVHKTHFLLARLGAVAFAEAVRRECEAVPAGAGGRASVFGRDQWERADERSIKNLLNYELPFEESERILDSLFDRHLGPQEPFARRLYLQPATVREMADAGQLFGYHTRSHRMLSRLTGDEHSLELRDGVSWIRGLTGQRRVSFCYPWGGAGTYTGETRRLLAAHGYSMAFNTTRRPMVVGHDDRFELPRLDTRDLPPYTDGMALSSAPTQNV